MNNIEKYEKGWRTGLPETACGIGSKLENTERQRKWILEIVKKYNINTINDIGAGDLNWVSHIDFPDTVQYTPYDLVPRQPNVVKFDLIKEIPPAADLIMCIWVLNHFPDEQSVKAMENIKASDAKYLIITNTPRWNQSYIEELGYIDKILLEKNDSELRFIELQKG